jgi:prepilin-type N-terminal cleavage/methylation domain-containing protein
MRNRGGVRVSADGVSMAEVNVSARPAAGFSLIELLVVIAVITLLAALLMPTYSQVMERAYCSVCFNNLRQLLIAHMCYAVNNRGKFPYSAGPINSSPSHNYRMWGGMSGGESTYIEQIWGHTIGRVKNPPGKYLKDYRVFFCPGALRRGLCKNYHAGTHWDDPEYLFNCMGKHPTGVIALGYWPFMGGISESDADDYVPGKPLPARPHTNYRPLSESAESNCWVFTDKYTRAGAKYYERIDPETAPHRLGLRNHLTSPYNVGHLDGHVDTHQSDPEQRLGQGGPWCYGWPCNRTYPHFDTDDDKR